MVDSGRAGFWAIGGYHISFRSDGRWYADDEPIENPRIARLFARHVGTDGSGGWVIDLRVDRQTVEIEDTPLVIVDVAGDSEQGFRVRANDDVESELDCESLWVGRAEVLYCRLDRGERGVMPARFLRPAYYRLASFLIEDDAQGAVLFCRGRRYPIGRCQS